jgi:hypothetical protein
MQTQYVPYIAHAEYFWSAKKYNLKIAFSGIGQKGTEKDNLG